MLWMSMLMLTSQKINVERSEIDKIPPLGPGHARICSVIGRPYLAQRSRASIWISTASAEELDA